MSDIEKGNQSHEVIRPHVIDGIQEYDNPMPRWWVLLFYMTIFWSALYLVWVHVLNRSSIEDEFQVASQSHATLTQGQGGGSGDYALLAQDEVAMTEAKDLYMSNCLPCHGAAGEGVIGPNLTDAYWIHGGKAEEVAHIIEEGVIEKGMPGWGSVIGRKKVDILTAYVLNLKGTQPENPKAPEGELYEGD